MPRHVRLRGRGHSPLSYDIRDRKLMVNEAEATLVRHIFKRFVTIGSATALVRELTAEGYATKSRVAGNGRSLPGRPFNKGTLYKLLSNRIYVGEVAHKGAAYPGEHQAIIDRALWDKVHAIIAGNGRTRANRTRAQTPALLKGLVFGPTGKAMTPSHTRKGGRLYRYYVSTDAIKNGADACPVRRAGAGEIEAAVVDQLRVLLRSPEMIVRTWQAARAEGEPIPEREVTEALQRLDPLWDELFPAEQARIVRLLVDRVDVNVDGLRIQLRTEGLSGIVDELSVREERRAA